MNNLEIIQEASIGGFHITLQDYEAPSCFFLNCGEIMICPPSYNSPDYGVIDYRDGRSINLDRITLHPDFVSAMDYASELLKEN